LAKKGTQEPSILVTRLIQEGNRYHKPLQLVSFDLDKAFDRVGNKIIPDTFQAFEVPEITIGAIQRFTLVVFAFVEVNVKTGLVITIPTGSGQGDPLSSILFLIATKPPNLTLSTNLRGLMYTTEGGLSIGPILFVDGNLNPLFLPSSEDIRPPLCLYQEHRKSASLTH